jgi:ribosome maturation factor RimP
MTTAAAELTELLAPVVTDAGLELVDIEVIGSGRAQTLRVTVDREGGVDLETIAETTRALSPVLDATDAVPVSYTLEVSSPGLERSLRRPEHYTRALGQLVSVKFRDGAGAAQRSRGTLTRADDEGLDLDVDGDVHHIAYADVVSARTVFEWGGAPKGGTRAASKQGSEA